MSEKYNRQIDSKRKLHGFKGVWIPVEFLEFDNGSLSYIEMHILAEIKNLCENGVYGNCVMSNDSFSKFIGCSTKSVERAIQHLTELNAISVEIRHSDRRGKVRYIKYNSDIFNRLTVAIECVDNLSNDQQTLSPDQQTLSPDQQTLSPRKSVPNADEYCNSSVSNNNNINNNNITKSTGAGAHSKNHSQVYKKRNTLEDTLESGKDIDEQKKASKKSPAEKLRDECYDIIDDVYSEHDYSYIVHDLLVEYFEFVSAVPEDKDNLCKRVKTAKAWKHKLDRLNELVKDGYDPRDIIQQSLDKKQYVFYPLQKSESSSRIKEGNQQNVKVSDPEWARKVIQDAIDNGEEFY